MSFPAQSTPFRVQEILPGYKALLTADATLETLLGGANRIYRAVGDDLEENAPTGNTWRRIILMARTSPDMSQNWMDGVINYSFNARVDVMPAKGEDPQINHDAIQQRIFELINGKKIADLSYAKILSPCRCYMRGTRVFKEQGQSWYFGAWAYNVPLAPITQES